MGGRKNWLSPSTVRRRDAVEAVDREVGEMKTDYEMGETVSVVKADRRM
jgi:hypothetical protein